MARTKDGTPELAAKMLQVLEAQRGLGGDSYPLTLKRLAELTDPSAPPALVEKAAARKEFAGRVVVAKKKSLDAPLALLEDLDQLAGSRLLLEYVLESICTPSSPACPVSKLKTKVPAVLKKPFEAAVLRQLQAQALPPTVGSVQVNRTKYLYLQRMPYRPPALVLAERMLAVLEARRGPGGGPYPLRLKQLVELADPGAPAALVKKALAEECFQQQIIGALAKLSLESPVALATDLERLADSPLVLESLLQAARTAASHASPATGWKRKLAPRLWPVFQEALERRTEAGTLPPTVCWVLIRKKPHYFLSEDLKGGRDLEGPRVATRGLEKVEGVHAGNFEQEFDAAFDRLDREKGSHNFVSLLDLRRALPMDRPIFDAGLNRLRFAQRYVVSAAEGRHGLSPEEREAAITEDGALLLYVSRRKGP